VRKDSDGEVESTAIMPVTFTLLEE
jgi:hypothetical protein